jgi:hypothetical protein
MTDEIGMYAGVDLDAVVRQAEEEFGVKLGVDERGIIERLNVHMHVEGRIDVPASEPSWSAVEDVIKSGKRFLKDLNRLVAQAEEPSELLPSPDGHRNYSIFRRNIAWEVSQDRQNFDGSHATAIPPLIRQIEEIVDRATAQLKTSTKLRNGEAKTHFGYDGFLDSCMTIWTMLPGKRVSKAPAYYRGDGQTYDGPLVRLIEILEGAIHPNFRVGSRAKIGGAFFEFIQKKVQSNKSSS